MGCGCDGRALRFCRIRNLPATQSIPSKGDSMPSVLRLSGLLILAVLFVGCGGGQTGPVRYPVTGTVTFDGNPLPDGDVQFIPADGKGPTDAGKIVAGKFSLETTAGKKKVSIQATREDPKNMVPSGIDPGKMEPAREDYIPAKYNTATELTADVPKGGSSSLDFKLTGDAAAK